MRNLNSTAKTRKIALGLAMALMISVTLVSSIAFATTGNNISDNIFSGLSEVYSILWKIALPIAGVCLAFCAFKIWAGGERGMETAKRTALYTLIAMAIVFLAPVIVKTVAGWFNSSGNQFSTLK